MSLTAQLIVAIVIDTITMLAISSALYALLSTFLWAFLAFVLSMIAGFVLNSTDAVVKAKSFTNAAVVGGVARAMNFFASKKAVEA